MKRENPGSIKLVESEEQEWKEEREQKMKSSGKAKCVVCGKSAKAGDKLKKCARCASVPYCSVGCQRDDWPRHKLSCVAVKK